MNAMLPAHLSETLNNLGDAARELAGEVRSDRAHREEVAREESKRQKRRSVIITTLLGLVAILVFALLTIVVQNRARSNENAQILRQTAQTSQRIADCTTAGGTCYEQSNARASDFGQMIIRAMIYKDSCERAVSGDAAVQDCVMRKLLDNPGPSAGARPAPSTTARPTPQPSPSG